MLSKITPWQVPKPRIVGILSSGYIENTLCYHSIWVNCRIAAQYVRAIVLLNFMGGTHFFQNLSLPPILPPFLSQCHLPWLKTIPILKLQIIIFSKTIKRIFPSKVDKKPKFTSAKRVKQFIYKNSYREFASSLLQTKS